MTYPSIRSPIRRAFSEEELVLFFVLLSPTNPGFHGSPATADGMLHMLNALDIPGAFERVAAALADLVKNGLIERGDAAQGQNTYRLTEAGRAAAARIDLAEIAWMLLPKWPIGALTPPVSVETQGRKIPVVRIGQIPFWELRSLVLGLGYRSLARIKALMGPGLIDGSHFVRPRFDAAIRRAMMQVEMGFDPRLPCPTAGAGAASVTLLTFDGLREIATASCRPEAVDIVIDATRVVEGDRHAGDQPHLGMLPKTVATALVAAPRVQAAPAPAVPSPAPVADRLGLEHHVFEGHDVVKLTLAGQDCWIALEVGRALEYGQEGNGLIAALSRDWPEEFVSGEHIVVAKGQILKEIKDAVNALSQTQRVGVRVNQLTLLTRAGLWLVLAKTEKPVGARFRRWLSGEVREAAEQGRVVETGINGETLPPAAPAAASLPAGLRHLAPQLKMEGHRAHVARVLDEALRDPAVCRWTNTRIAAAFGFCSKAVERRRELLEAQGIIPVHDVLESSDGKLRTRNQRAPVADPMGGVH